MFSRLKRFFGGEPSRIPQQDSRVDTTHVSPEGLAREAKTEEEVPSFAEEVSSPEIPSVTHEDVLLALADIEGEPAFAGIIDELKAEYSLVPDQQRYFSKIDGADLRTPESRLLHIERLRNLDELDKAWYAGKQSNPHMGAKEYGESFVSTRGIESLLDTGAPLEEVIQRCHWWQMAGTREQRTIKEYLNTDEYGHILSIKVESVDRAGNYRDMNVGIGGHHAPPHENVNALMTLFVNQIDDFSQKMSQRKDTVTPSEYQDLIIEFASYVKHNFIQIHPMADGNGRTSRALYEYIVVKHLGPDNTYRHIPLQNGSEKNYIGGAHGRIIEIEVLHEWAKEAPYDPDIDGKFGKEPFGEIALIRRLKNLDIDEAIFTNRPHETWYGNKPNDSRWKALVTSIKEAIEHPQRY